MKRALLGVLATVVVLSAGVTTFAAGPRGGRNFVDKNGDGICDNANSVCIYVDEDGDGICDNCGIQHWCGMTGTGCGKNFVDADGDGICDNYVSGQGGGCGRGFRGGRGRK